MKAQRAVVTCGDRGCPMNKTGSPSPAEPCISTLDLEISGVWAKKLVLWEARRICAVVADVAVASGLRIFR